jgi:5-formyltetrahydrofolate cyclo-ligase
VVQHFAREVSLETVGEEKQAQRKMALASRNAIVAENAAEKIALNFLEAIPVRSDAIVSLYLPIGSEIKTGVLFQKLEAKGITCALPVIKNKDEPLIFRTYSCGDPLVAGGFGTKVPIQGQVEILPDIIVTPLLAFDDAGYRMGYGGGFYDRTLEKLRRLKHCVAVGYAFEGQKVDKVVTGQFDQKLDWVITEQQVRKFH